MVGLGMVGVGAWRRVKSLRMICWRMASVVRRLVFRMLVVELGNGEPG